MAGQNLNRAIEELTQLASDTARLHNTPPIELVVYTAALALMPHMTAGEALQQFAEARNDLARAGVAEKS